MRIAEITTRTVRVFEVPRSLLNDFLELEESKQVGVYYLFNEGEIEGLSSCYIGQSGNVGERLSQHNKKKDFWDRAIVAVSHTNTMTDTHARYLEWKSIGLANKAKRFQLENGNGGSRPHTTPPLEADCKEILDTINVLISTLGFPALDSPSYEKKRNNKIYQCVSKRGANARAVFSEGNMTVLAGSHCAIKPTLKATTSKMKEQRGKFIQEGIVSHNEDTGEVIFTKDYTFKSPSSASSFVMYQSSNGWTDWKDENKKTLDEIERAIKE